MTDPKFKVETFEPHELAVGTWLESATENQLLTALNRLPIDRVDAIGRCAYANSVDRLMTAHELGLCASACVWCADARPARAS